MNTLQAQKTWAKKRFENPGAIALLGAVAAAIILFRQKYLFDTDPYLHLATAEYVANHGFPEQNPFIQIMGPQGFNYLSEKWLFIKLLTPIYKLPINDITGAKIIIAAVFGATILMLALILKELGSKPVFALTLFALPFQVLLKLRPEPLGILLTLSLILVLVKNTGNREKTLLSAAILLVHSQAHAFFAADILILIFYSALNRKPKLLFAFSLLAIAPAVNPYKTQWLTTLYYDTIPRMGFQNTSLAPTELSPAGAVETLLFFALFAYSLQAAKKWKSGDKILIYTVTGLFLITFAFTIRTISYSTAFLALTMGTAISRDHARFMPIFIASLAVVNLFATVFYPGLMMPGYSEDMQLEILGEISADETVLTQWDLSPYVIYYTGAKTVTAADNYYLWMHSKPLYKDYEDLLYGRKNTLEKFDFTVLYFDKRQFPTLSSKTDDYGLTLVAENEAFAAYKFSS